MMNGDPANLTAFLMTMGNMANQKRGAKLAPGGIAQVRPAPSKFRAQDGVTDSDFVSQIISAAQSMTQQQGGILTPQQPQMPQQQQPTQPGGLMQMIAALGGGGQ